MPVVVIGPLGDMVGLVSIPPPTPDEAQKWARAILDGDR